MPTKDLKRDAVKYVRDKAKAHYNKTGICDICGNTEGVDFHHFYSVTNLFDKWLKDNNLAIVTEQDVLDVRDRFIAEHQHELYDAAVNLCHKHHEKLHSLYGTKPTLASAPKQAAWVEKQKAKQ